MQGVWIDKYISKTDTLIWKLKLTLTGSIKPKQPKDCIYLVKYATGFLNTVLILTFKTVHVHVCYTLEPGLLICHFIPLQ